jgi:uncharacterized protein YkwD
MAWLRNIKLIFMKLKINLLLILFFSMPVKNNGQCFREQVINDYNNIYLQSAVSDTQLTWTGSTVNCLAGTISELAQKNTLARINYYRKLAGLPSTITFDSALYNKCQDAALMIAANSSINRNPPTSWSCYTADGAEILKYAEIALNIHSASAIDLYMNDIGTDYAGHRRLILYSRATVFGHGSTDKSDALWVIGSLAPVDVRPVTFPSSGFFPAPLISSSVYWSFSLHGAGFGSAIVQMFDSNGTSVSVEQFPVTDGYGDNTIVWHPSNIVNPDPYDVKYTVRISNVLVDGNFKEYTYDVILCQPVHPPLCPSGQRWSETDCSCVTETDITDTGMTKPQIIINNPFSGVLETRIHSFFSGDMKIIIVDNTGRVLEGRNLCMSAGAELTITWETALWKQGLYLILLEDQKGVSTVLKIVKQ